MTDTDDQRTPPHDIGAEQWVLGGMLMSTDAIGDVIEQRLTVGDFYRPVHATIYNAILDLFGLGEPTDQQAVAALLADRGDLGRIGGAGYLYEITALTANPLSAGYHAKTVRRRARRRRVIEAGMRIQQLGYQVGDLDDDELPDRAADLLQQATATDQNADLEAVGDLIPGFEEELAAGGQRGLDTGLADLDMLTNGLLPGLWVIAARPSMGKTIVLTDLARSVALRQRQPAVFFSLEMSKQRLMRRLVAAEARVPLHILKGGNKKLDPHDRQRVSAALADMRDAPLYIDASTSVRISDINARVRRLAKKKALGAVFVDYVQLMESMGGRANDNREREVARISRGLKVLSEDLQIPVIVAAQLNRGPEQRSDKKPILADLRESGAIEQDADVVVLLHREDYYDKESGRAGEVDLIVAKNRDGETDTVTAAAQLHFSRFVDMAIDDSFYVNAAAKASSN